MVLLCFLPKVLEKLAHDQMVSFLTKSKILDPYQSDFRKNHNTLTSKFAFIKLTNDIKIDKDRRLATLLLQFDFSNALDNVSPSSYCES